MVRLVVYTYVSDGTRCISPSVLGVRCTLYINTSPICVYIGCSVHTLYKYIPNMCLYRVFGAHPV